MQATTREQALKRLNYIDGHLAGVRRMIKEEQYCVDVLKQTYAVRRALEKMESLLLDGHLPTCVIAGVREGRGEPVIGELPALDGLAHKSGAWSAEPVAKPAARPVPTTPPPSLAPACTGPRAPGPRPVCISASITTPRAEPP